MNKSLIALTLLASTALALPANAAPIIQFAQTSDTNTIVATTNAGNTATTIVGNDVAINIAQNAGGPLGAAYFDFNAASTDAAIPIGTGALQHYTGSFAITSAPNGGTNYLSGTFSDAALGVGAALVLAIGSPPDTLNLTSDLIPASQLADPSAAAFSMTNVDPQIHIVGATIGAFTSTVAGNVSASTIDVMEPSTLGILGLGLLGLGMIRRKPE